jgi:hypothetical protein
MVHPHWWSVAATCAVTHTCCGAAAGCSPPGILPQVPYTVFAGPLPGLVVLPRLCGEHIFMTACNPGHCAIPWHLDCRDHIVSGASVVAVVLPYSDLCTCPECHNPWFKTVTWGNKHISVPCRQALTIPVGLQIWAQYQYCESAWNMGHQN